MQEHTPLIQKLGYKPGQTVYAPQAPEWFATYLRGEGVHIAHALPADWAHLFIKDSGALQRWLGEDRLHSITHAIWISWLKSGDHHTSIKEQTLRDLVLPQGWVDIKVCSIDETWSGLKFVRQRK